MRSSSRMTGLPNGKAFQRRIASLTKSAHQRFAVCQVDLDRFDRVNQALGHHVGDAVLVEAGHRLTGLAGQPGHFVAHLGSDRFGILLEETSDHSSATWFIEEALSVLARPYIFHPHQLEITASAGVAAHSTPGVSAPDVMAAANAALHWAKADGRAQYRIFESERHARDVAAHQLWLAMPAALACGEFTLRYQPLVDLRSGAVAGVEALARWNHSEHGLLGPERFISTAEETGLIVPLGALLLRQACEQAASWSGGALAPYVSVNLAAAQLRDPTLFTTVVRTLDHTGLPPQRLQLEVTEHSVIDTDQRSVDALRGLARLGVRIAIDDFGTGYSNLAALQTLPLCDIKLARTLTQGGKRDFLTTVVMLGRALNLTVTAEGIETAEQATLMHELECQTGQGWYYSKPLTARGIRSFIANTAARGGIM